MNHLLFRKGRTRTSSLNKLYKYVLNGFKIHFRLVHFKGQIHCKSSLFANSQIMKFSNNRD